MDPGLKIEQNILVDVLINGNKKSVKSDLVWSALP